MIVVSNRLSVAPGREAEFEGKFEQRARRVETAEGFIRLEILRPLPRAKDESGRWQSRDAANEARVYEVRSYWRSLADFDNWSQSDAFRSAHEKVLGKDGRPSAEKLPSGLLTGRPEVSFFEVTN